MSTKELVAICIDKYYGEEEYAKDLLISLNSSDFKLISDENKKKCINMDRSYKYFELDKYNVYVKKDYPINGNFGVNEFDVYVEHIINGITVYVKYIIHDQALHKLVNDIPGLVIRRVTPMRGTDKMYNVNIIIE